MELLGTYAWAILVVLVIIGALYYLDFQFFKSPEVCNLPATGLTCVDFEVGSNTVKLVISNSLGQQVIINDIDIEGCLSDPLPLGPTIDHNQRITFTVGSCTFDKTKNSLEFYVTYTTESGLSHRTKGEIRTQLK